MNADNSVVGDYGGRREIGGGGRINGDREK